MSEPCAEQSGSALPPTQAVASAIVAKVGVAARPSQSATTRATLAARRRGCAVDEIAE